MTLGPTELELVGRLLDIGIDIAEPAIRQAMFNVSRAPEHELLELAERHARLTIAPPLADAQDLGEGEG